MAMGLICAAEASGQASPFCPAGIHFSAAQTRDNNAIATRAAEGSGNRIALVVVAGGGSVNLILEVNRYFE